MNGFISFRRTSALLAIGLASLSVFQSGVARAQDTLRPEHSFGRAGIALPEGASSIKEEEFKKLHNAGMLKIVTPKQLLQDRAVEQRKSLADRELVKKYFANQPELLERLTRQPSANDRDVVKNPDGTFQFTIKLNNGEKQVITTMGEESTYAELATMIRAQTDAEAQHQLYTTLYKVVPQDMVRQFPHPDKVKSMSAIEIRRFTENLAKFIQPNIARLIGPIDNPATPVCENEIGYGDGTDQTGSSCAHSATGIMKNKAFPLKSSLSCVKNQGGRGTCVAFAITSAMESAVKLKTGTFKNLSEEKLYYQAKAVWYPSTFGDGLSTSGMMSDIVTKGFQFPYESKWDYNPSYSRVANAATSTYTGSCSGYTGEHCSNTNHQGDLFCSTIGIFTFCGYNGSVSSVTGHKATGTTQLINPMSMDLSLTIAKIYLAAKIPLVLSIPVPPSFDGAASSGYATYVGTGETSRGGHAVALVGYINNADLPAGAPAGSGGGYFIIKNSWGKCWKDAGYIYLPYNWVKGYASSISAMTSIL